MAGKISERRLVENEKVFRQLNERFLRDVQEVNALAEEHNQPEFAIGPKEIPSPLQFYCECSAIACRERITIDFHDYAEIHKPRNRFIVIAGHEQPAIEKVLRQPDYVVVEKINR